MREDHVLDEQGLFDRERARQAARLGLELADLAVHELHAHDKMADELALGRVLGHAVVVELPELADVVEKAAQEQQIAIDVLAVVLGQTVQDRR